MFFGFKRSRLEFQRAKGLGFFAAAITAIVVSAPVSPARATTETVSDAMIGPESVGASESYTTTVAGVIPPEKAGDTWIFLLSAGGRALRVSEHDRPRVELLKNAAGQARFFQIEATNLGSYDRIDSLYELSQVQSTELTGALPIEPMDVNASWGRAEFDFSRYTLNAQGIFNYFRSFGLRTNSQCFHRAYYWAFNLWRNTGALTHKVFMFFSQKYIRTFRYHWWFHVAPYVYENGQEVVLDPTFLKKPVSMKEWTDKFLRNDPVCPTVNQYMGHSAHGQNDWCFLVKTPMYYYHPNIVEKALKEGSRIAKWDKGYLALARRSR